MPQRFPFSGQAHDMSETKYSPALHRFALLVWLCALGLIAMGGLVTSHGVGMSVPDWPTSYGYNMFALPVSTWLTGGVFQEHTHRLWASAVGVLVVALTRWLGGRRARLPLAIVGGLEIAAGQGLFWLGPEWRGAGHFLSGIGGVVVLAAIVWVRHEPAPRPLPRLGWLAFWLVQLQGLLGGLRVVLDAHVFAGTKLGVWFGVFHGCLGQIFLVLLGVIALLTSRWWSAAERPRLRDVRPVVGWMLVVTTGLVFCQLILGATMRHQHAGLSIADFPLAHGRWWPDTSPEAVARYNAERVEVLAQNPITAFQIDLQMAHRLMALAILFAISACLVKINQAVPRGHVLRRLAWGWLLLVLTQAGLGAWTIWSNKAADVATLHVVVGAVTLVSGALISIIHFRCCGKRAFLASEAVCGEPARPSAAAQAQPVH